MFKIAILALVVILIIAYVSLKKKETSETLAMRDLAQVGAAVREQVRAQAGMPNYDTKLMQRAGMGSAAK